MPEILAPHGSARACEGVADSFHEGRAARAFEALRRPEVRIAVWRRRLPLRHREPLETWTRRRAPSLEYVGHHRDLPLGDWLASLDDGSTRAWLASDVTQLLERFEPWACGPRWKISLGTVTSDMCRKFHMDYVRLRLVTTYVGPGTEWVADDDVDPESLRQPPECPDEANRRIVVRREAVRRVATGDVVLMKGAAYDPPRRGAVHRSPPIEGTGLVRLVLAVTAS